MGTLVPNLMRGMWAGMAPQNIPENGNVFPKTGIKKL